VTASAPPAPPDPLAPVRQALLDTARTEAARTLAEADADCASVLARSRAEADTILAEARARGEADAADLLAAERRKARRQARTVVLAAQRAAYDQLHAQLVVGVQALRRDPAYARWREQVTEQVRAALGPDAVVTEAPQGGVLAESGGRRAATTLADLAERALDRLGPDLAGLWSS
jgi:vacuolar-type H+-ATPase subunit E/Vma4